MIVTIRRARPDDLEFLHALTTHDEVDPFLAAGRDRSREALAEEIERSAAEPEEFGRFVVEVDGERVGTVTFECPDVRGRGVGVQAARLLQRHLIRELGFHRLQLEVYGFNEAAQRHAEHAGYVREGVRRRAYRRGDGWVDGILYGLTAEDLDDEAEPSG